MNPSAKRLLFVAAQTPSSQNVVSYFYRNSEGTFQYLGDFDNGGTLGTISHLFFTGNLLYIMDIGNQRVVIAKITEINPTQYDIAQLDVINWNEFGSNMNFWAFGTTHALIHLAHASLETIICNYRLRPLINNSELFMANNGIKSLTVDEEDYYTVFQNSSTISGAEKRSRFTSDISFIWQCPDPGYQGAGLVVRGDYVFAGFNNPVDNTAKIYRLNRSDLTFNIASSFSNTAIFAMTDFVDEDPIAFTDTYENTVKFMNSNAEIIPISIEFPTGYEPSGIASLQSVFYSLPAESRELLITTSINSSSTIGSPTGWNPSLTVNAAMTVNATIPNLKSMPPVQAGITSGAAVGVRQNPTIEIQADITSGAEVKLPPQLPSITATIQSGAEVNVQSGAQVKLTATIQSGAKVNVQSGAQVKLRWLKVEADNDSIGHLKVVADE